MISNNNSKSRNGVVPRGNASTSSSTLNTSNPAATHVSQVNTIGTHVGIGNNGSENVSAMPVRSVNENVTSLSDIRSLLQPINSTMSLPPGVCPYDHIIEMIRGLDLQDDGITMNHKIKSIETDFCNIVRDENMLCESMEYINDKALEDGETALKFALLFASHNFEALAMKDTKVRSAMLTLLQKNFVNAENYRIHDRERLYNSITLLGEYYHRVRLADNSPINILGESLLGLLIREIKEEQNVNDVKLAKLILSQITLNGDLLRNLHKTEISQLLYHIRKNLIEQPNLKPTVKAIMLMTLDLFYSNFASLGSQLEVMYTKYFIMEDDDEGNNNQNSNQSNQHQQPPSSEPHSKQHQPTQSTSSPQQQNYICPSTHLQQPNGLDEHSFQSSSNNTSYENGDSGNINDNTGDDPDSYKKWSEQVCEDSFEECNKSTETDLNISGSSKDKTNRGYGDDREKKHSSNRSYDNDSDRQSRNYRRSFQPRQSPRPLKMNSNEQIQNCRDSQNSGNEERDESKPLPRWRAPRFNRDDQNIDSRNRNAQNRFSASFDDDRQSIRSDGGSIRLYSINDRLKHAQEKIERSGNLSTYTGIANSNWDRQSQRDDRSERSYMSNYERGNNHRRGGGGRNFNNRQNYDKPPRFQKNKNNGGHYNRDKSSETWRNSNSNIQYLDENSSFNTNGPESNSRSSSRARTLPRPAKSRMDNNNQTNSFRRSQSPNSYQRARGSGSHNHHNQHQNKNRTPNFNNRYSSQSSLASEASSTLDRRHHQRNRSFSKRSSQQQDSSNDIQHWNDKETNSELVRNARHTTDYMNYLSSKK